MWFSSMGRCDITKNVGPVVRAVRVVPISAITKAPARYSRAPGRAKVGADAPLLALIAHPVGCHGDVARRSCCPLCARQARRAQQRPCDHPSAPLPLTSMISAGSSYPAFDRGDSSSYPNNEVERQCGRVIALPRAPRVGDTERGKHQSQWTLRKKEISR